MKLVKTYDQSQGTSTFGVNEEQRRDRENDLYGSVAQRGVERLGSCVTDLLKNCRTVERNDCENISIPTL